MSVSLAGCAGVAGGGSLFYLEPYKLAELTCEELNKRLASTGAQIRKSEELRQKASRDPAGPLVNAMVYAPDYNKARYEHSLYEQAARRKSCPSDAPKQ
jgi:hypothetical protein